MGIGIRRAPGIYNRKHTFLRCRKTDNGADGSEKRLILMLNKIDLVPRTPERVVEPPPEILLNAATKVEQVCRECPDI